MQPEGNGDLHPVLFISRKLLERETRYSTIEKEYLGLVWAVDQLMLYYLYDRQFEIITDHRPLRF